MINFMKIIYASISFTIIIFYFSLLILSRKLLKKLHAVIKIIPKQTLIVLKLGNFSS